MQRLWVTREIDVPAAAAWNVFTDVDQWPQWGPSVRSVQLDVEALGPGATGSIRTAVGVRIPFEITRWDEGHHWSWKVAGLGATDHIVEMLGPARCRAGFGVPWPAAPYLAVCRIALARIDRLATRSAVS